MIEPKRFPSYSKVFRKIIPLVQPRFVAVLCLAVTLVNLHASPSINPEAIRNLARVSQGFPWAELQAYRGHTDAVDVLVKMLEDDNEKAAWPAVVTMIGYLSPVNNALANRLVNYLESSSTFRDCPTEDPETFRVRDRVSEALNREDYEPKLNVLTALGYMAARSPDLAALTRLYLRLGKATSFWENRVRWQPDSKYMSKPFRNQLLSRNAAIGLHLAERAESASRQQPTPRPVAYSKRATPAR